MKMKNGDWINNKKEGKGIMKYLNGYEYNGDWKEDLKEGKGKLKLMNGYEYNGNWLKKNS